MDAELSSHRSKVEVQNEIFEHKSIIKIYIYIYISYMNIKVTSHCSKVLIQKKIYTCRS